MNRPLRIGIDARELEGRRTGVGRYLFNLLREWSEIAPQNDYILFFKRNIPDDQLFKKGCFSKRLFNLPRLLDKNIIWEQIYLPLRLMKGKCNLFFSPSYTFPLLIKGTAIVTIHDISYEVNPDWFPFKERLIRRLFTRLSAKKVNFIVTDTEFSKGDILKYYRINEQRVKVIYPAPDKIFDSKIDEDGIKQIKARYNTGERFLLYVGSILNRRPIDILLRAFSDVLKDSTGLKLFIVGENRTFPKKDFDGLIDCLHINDYIIQLDYVPDNDLAILYKAAQIFIYPSFYEGFGLPVLEAMSSGIPVIVPNLASFPEVVGNCGILLDHLDRNEMTKAILRLIRDESLRSLLGMKGKERAKNFSWSISAQRHLDLFREGLS